jgi:hypothetical protein
MEPAKATYPRDGKPWGDKEDEYILESIAAGKTIDEINVRLKRNPANITKRIALLQNPIKPQAAPQLPQAPQPLQTWDDKTLPTNTTPAPAKVGKRWTDEDVEVFKSMLKAGSKPEEIAEKLQRTPKGILARVDHTIVVMAVGGSTVEEISAELSVPVAYINTYLQFNSKKVEEAKVATTVKAAKAKPAANDDAAKLLSICVEIRDLLKVLVERLPPKGN